MNNFSFTATAADLIRTLGNAVLFTAKDPKLKVLSNVRLCVTPGRLIAEAGDQFAIGQLLCSAEVSHVGEALIEGDEVKRVLKELRSLPKGNRVSTLITVTGGRETVRFDHVTGTHSIEVPRTDDSLPPFQRLFPANLPASGATPMAMNATLLARFSKVTDEYTSWQSAPPLTFHPQPSPTKPIVVLKSTWFRGLLMPVRIDTAAVAQADAYDLFT